MRIYIQRENEMIVTSKDFSDIESRGEISHIICELELIKKELLNLWNKYEVQL